ncbi:MAG: glycosyltransferase family 92 protein [Firmicutes bacterium]|nr:glycosyltransferase family 92 protein [Bacillota bacterium]
MEKVAKEKTISQINNSNESTNKKVFVLNNGSFEQIDTVELSKYKALNPEDWWLAKDNAISHKYNIAVQCIARQEEKYFKEWIEHHLRIGIEFIYIYDNNDVSDKGKLEKFLQSALSLEDFSKIKVIPWHEAMLFQQFEALNDCVEKHKSDIKWLLSIDLDEFFIVEKPMAEFLEDFSYASQVYFSWESIGADGQLHYENKPVVKRFKNTFDCKDYGQGKIMFRPKRLKQWSIHSAELFQGKTVNVLHKEIEVPDSYNHIYKTAWIKHYFTKSLEEWMEKMRRGCADHLWCRRYSHFFEVNPDLIKHYNVTFSKQVQVHGNSSEELLYDKYDFKK